MASSISVCVCVSSSSAPDLTVSERRGTHGKMYVFALPRRPRDKLKDVYSKRRKITTVKKRRRVNEECLHSSVTLWLSGATVRTFLGSLPEFKRHPERLSHR